MAYSHKIKEQARRSRKEGKYLAEIAKNLGASISAVHEWVQDVELPGRREAQDDQLHFARSQMQQKYARLRQEAYEQTDLSLLEEPLVRDFIVMYLGEGYRRNRNEVQICNSNPLIMGMSFQALRRIGLPKSPTFRLKIYPDMDASKKKRFWGKQVGIKPSQITLTNDKKKEKPSKYRRSEHGILYMRVTDTYLRARLQALMDTVQGEWKTNLFS